MGHGARELLYKRDCLELDALFHKMWKVTLFILFVGCCEAADPKIVGGQDAKPHQFPYQVSIRLRMGGIIPVEKHICGGSIITPKWIVTAGHCIREVPSTGTFYVVAGIHKLSDKDGQRVKVVKTIVNPNYQITTEAALKDIALMQLKSELSFNENVQPINLPLPNQQFSGLAVLSGWGVNSLESPSPALTLQTTEAELIDYKKCQELMSNFPEDFHYVDETNICSGPLTGGIAACSGDSGGPLAQDNVLVGVVSWGIGPCGTVGAPSVYASVSYFRSFIDLYVDDLPF